MSDSRSSAHAPSGLCSAHRYGEDPDCRICYPNKNAPLTLRERLGTWPSVRVQVELAPWHWRVSWHRDDVHPLTFLLAFGPLSVEVYA